MHNPAFVRPCNPLPVAVAVAVVSFPNRRALRFKIRSRSSQQHLRFVSGDRPRKSDVISDTLRLLEWDKLCDAVSSFAGTPLGREATKAKLLSMELTFEESKKLLVETTAAVELNNYGARLDFAGIDVVKESNLESWNHPLGSIGYQSPDVPFWAVGVCSMYKKYPV